MSQTDNLHTLLNEQVIHKKRFKKSISQTSSLSVHCHVGLNFIVRAKQKTKPFTIWRG